MTPSILYSTQQYHNLQHQNHLQSYLPAHESVYPYQPQQYFNRNAAFDSRLNFQYPYWAAMATTSTNDLEDLQRLSDQYQADLPGPLIGDKQPINDLMVEYAQADPAYRVKTAALTQTYLEYRKIKGDGQCGWRGAVFGYFETLLQLGDYDLVQQERVRLQSFEDTMRMAGIDYDIIIDMFDFTWELFENLQKAVERQDKSEGVLLESLNDEIKSNSIVYHFKMMTSAFMQLRADQYEPFLEMPIADYRVSRIDPSNQEIDQIGLQALTDAVIAPAQFAIEVLYLDRSMGDEVTPHSFVADPADKPTIRLLYRPGHYDMVYKNSRPVQQVFFQRDSLMSQQVEMAHPNSISADLQAFLFAGPQESSSFKHNGSSYDHDRSMGMQHGISQVLSLRSDLPSYLSTPQYHQPMNKAPTLLPSEFPHELSMQYSSPCQTDLSPSPHPLTPSISTGVPSLPTVPKQSPNEPQIRLCASCIDYGSRHESVPLCSQPYGSAVTLSPAHFRNQEFQPQMWKAEEEYMKT